MGPPARVAVLLAVMDPTLRRDTALALSEAGYDVWPAQNYDEAAALLHASARRLIVVVGPDCVPLLQFAASDRRIVDHHAYIALREPGTRTEADLCQPFPCLTLWTVVSPTRGELKRTAAAAARALGANQRLDRELVTR
jgi:hypothetical protein